MHVRSTNRVRKKDRPYMPLTTRSAKQIAEAEHDAQVRDAEEAHDRIFEFVSETAAALALPLAVPGNRTGKAQDLRVEESRQQQPVTPRLELKRTEAYLNHKKEGKSKGSTVPAYLRLPTAKVLTKRQLAALEAEKAKKTPEQIKAEVHEKTKALVADAQQKTVNKARVIAQQHDELGIFDPEVNEARALSVCRWELRRTVSLQQLKQEAARLVAGGKPPRSEVAEAIASGTAIDLKTPDLLRGRLELLDEKFAEDERRRLAEIRRREQQAQQQRGSVRDGRRPSSVLLGPGRAAAPMALLGAMAPSAALSRAAPSHTPQ